MVPLFIGNRASSAGRTPEYLPPKQTAERYLKSTNVNKYSDALFFYVHVLSIIKISFSLIMKIRDAHPWDDGHTKEKYSLFVFLFRRNLQNLFTSQPLVLQRPKRMQKMSVGDTIRSLAPNLINFGSEKFSTFTVTRLASV